MGTRGVQHAHPEAGRASRNGLPDLAPADDAERRAPNVASKHQTWRPHTPAAGTHETIALGDAACRCEHQGEGQIRSRLGQHARRVTDSDASSCGGLQIDVVDADR